MKKYVLLFALSIPITSLCQTSTQQEEASTITVAELRDHIFYLASDELSGRYPGTPGYDKAAEYAVTQFKQAGLITILPNVNGDTTYRQPVLFTKYHWNETNTITLEKKNSKDTYRIGENYNIFYAKPFEQSEFEGEVVYVSAGIREPEYGIDNYKDVDVKGKWVLCYLHTPDTIDNLLPENVIMKYNMFPAGEYLKARHAREAGAIGVLFMLRNERGKFWTNLSENCKEQIIRKGNEKYRYPVRIPVAVIDSSIIASLFRENGYNPIKDKANPASFPLEDISLKLTKHFTITEFNSDNIVGFVEGTDSVLKNEFITIGAHLDHLGIHNGEIMNGADDNASGSAGVLEIAEAVTKSNPKRSVIFCLYTAEEIGCDGSWYFVLNPPVSLENIKVYINLDMIGRPDEFSGKGIAPLHGDTINQNLKDIIVRVNQKFPVPELDWAYADTSVCGTSSDNAPFHAHNIPNVFFSDVDHPDYHTPGDDAEKIDYEYLKKNCQFIYHLIMELANSDELILKPD